MCVSESVCSAAESAAALTPREATICGLGVRLIRDDLVVGFLGLMSDDDGAHVGSTGALGHGLGLRLLHLAHPLRCRAHELLVIIILVVGRGAAAGHGNETLTLLPGSWLICTIEWVKFSLVSDFDVKSCQDGFVRALCQARMGQVLLGLYPSTNYVVLVRFVTLRKSLPQKV